MSGDRRSVFWQRTKRLTGLLLLVWLVINLLVPWFARDLHRITAFGFPVGYWLAAQGALLLYLLIIFVYVLAMDRLEASLLAAAAAAAEPAVDEGSTGPA